MDIQSIRNLSSDESALLASLVSEYDLPVVFHIPTEFKILTVKVVCSRCKSEAIQYIKMAHFSSSTWLSVKAEEQIEGKTYPTEHCLVSINYCRQCFAIPEPQQMRAAEFYHKLISEQYAYLQILLKGRSITKRTAIETIIISAQRIAQCYETPDKWQDYLPKQLRGQINE